MKSISNNIKISLAVLFGAALMISGVAFAGTFNSQSNTGSPTADRGIVSYTFFSATTTSATSTNIVPAFDADGRYDDGSLDIRGAQRVTMTFTRGGATGANTGVSRFEVEGYDGSSWIDINRLIINDVSATATSTYTPTVAATTTSSVSIDLGIHNFQKIRCVVIETTDGDHTCKALAEF